MITASPTEVRLLYNNSEKLATTNTGVSITGDLIVSGTTTTVNQTNLDVSDNIIGLNRGASTNTNEGSRLGLPPFIQSLFAEKVDIINNDNDPTVVTNTLDLCEGETYTLAAEDIPGATYTWTLDGNPLTNTTYNLVDIW